MPKHKQVVDMTVLDSLCACGCSKREIAAYFGVPFSVVEKNVRNNYTCSFDVYKEKFKPKKKMGVPRKEIDFELLEELCKIQCTEAEVASVLKVSVATLAERIKEKFNCTFLEYFKNASASGKVSLRRRIFESALSGNVPTMIFLSKNTLGMSDHGVLDTESKPLPISVNITMRKNNDDDTDRTQ